MATGLSNSIFNQLEPSLFPMMPNVISNNAESNGNFHPLNSLYQLNLSQGTDGLPKEWLQAVTKLLLADLNDFGVSVLDNFLGTYGSSDKVGDSISSSTVLADKVANEVYGLKENGMMVDGRTVSHSKENSHWSIREDKIAWIGGFEQGFESISKLISIVSAVMSYANKHENAGTLKNYNIYCRTRAMVACYPGSGSRYIKHVDNPGADGRCITAIYYVNKEYKTEDGGILRIYPRGSNRILRIEPIFDRMVFFWSDRRNPHEVLPSSCMRYAITIWYLDQNEKERYEQRAIQQVDSTSTTDQSV